jgi:hypothetical protein
MEESTCRKPGCLVALPTSCRSSAIAPLELGACAVVALHEPTKFPIQLFDAIFLCRELSIKPEPEQTKAITSRRSICHASTLQNLLYITIEIGKKFKVLLSFSNKFLLAIEQRVSGASYRKSTDIG